MFSVGWGEIGLIILVAVLIFKPEEWPELFYKAGLFIRKIQRFITSLKYQIEEVLQEREIEEMKQKSYARAKELDKKILPKKKKVERSHEV